VDAGGYAALHVEDVIRAFGTFASGAEYATFLALAVAAGWAWVLHGRWMPLLVLPALLWADVLESSRGIVLFVFSSMLVITALRTRRRAFAVGLVIVGSAAVVGLNQFAGSTLATRAQSTGNALLIHQVEGLTNPLDPERSTLLIHWDLVVGGVTYGLQHPLGLGTAATNGAGAKFSTEERGSEVDISDAFISLGLGGGVLYSAIVLVSLRRAAGLYMATGDRVALAVTGMLIAGIGQWLNGQFYAVSPLIWLLIGWMNRTFLECRSLRDTARG
jgi:hypothetical protein